MSTSEINHSASTEEKVSNLCQWLIEKKSKDVISLDIQGKSNITDAVIVAGATSLRHAQGLADFILDMAKENHYEFLHMEGYNTGSWILLDFNDILVNILQPEHRDLYRLEELFPSAKKSEYNL